MCKVFPCAPVRFRSYVACVCERLIIIVIIKIFLELEKEENGKEETGSLKKNPKSKLLD